MKKYLLAFIGLLILAFVTASVFTRTRISDSDKIKNSIVKVIAAETMHVKMVADTKMSGEYKVEAEGDLKSRGDGFTDAQIKVKITSAGEGIALTSKSEIVLADKKTYYKINEMPPVLANAEQVIGKWIAVSESTAEKDDFRSKLLASLNSSSEIFGEVKKLGREKIGVDSTTKYSANLSPEGYSSFLEQLASVSGQTMPSEVKEQLRKNIENLNAAPVSVWIDNHGYLRKFVLVSENPQTSATTTIDAEFSDFGKNVNIEQPSPAS